jgi:hypothetical protein
MKIIITSFYEMSNLLKPKTHVQIGRLVLDSVLPNVAEVVMGGNSVHAVFYQVTLP